MSKKAKTKSLRNILQSPFHILWKEKTEEEINPVQNALKELLPAAKLDSCVRSKQSKAMKESEGQKEVVSKESQGYINRSYLVPGFQSVVRGLEKQELCCAVMVNDVTSSLLHKVVLSYAHTNNIPVLVIPDLKLITKSTLGYAAMVLGFKRTVAESPGNIFYPVYRMVSQNPTFLETTFVKKSANEDIVPVQGFKVKELHQPENKNLYLYRKNVQERAFVPRSRGKANLSKNSETINENINDFISLGNSSNTTYTTPAVHKKILSKNYSDNEDEDDDSDDSNIFFVDNKPDGSLLKTERLKVESKKSEKASDFSKFQPTSAKKCTLTNVEESQKFNPKSTSKLKSFELNTMYLSKKPKTGDFSVSKKIKKNKKNLLKKDELKNYLESNSVAEVNFTPMSIKTVMTNAKKVRIKKKVKSKV